MECPYKDSLIPRCDIQAHPWRQHIEYCRVCNEWRDLNNVGNPIGHLMVIGLMAAIVLIVLQSAMEPEPTIDLPPQNSTQAQSLEVVPPVAL
jgi:cytochrome b